MRNVEKMQRSLKIEETSIKMLNFSVPILLNVTYARTNTETQQMQRTKYSAIIYLLIFVSNYGC